MQVFYFCVGIIFLALAKFKHLLQGYTTPKPYDVSLVDESIDYDLQIAQRYEDKLQELADTAISAKRILELGPGSDLGTGLTLVEHGAAQYTGFDRHDLASAVPEGFYNRFSSRSGLSTEALNDGRVEYVVREDFDLEALGSPEFDVALSNAAFEHFDNVPDTVCKLTRVMNPGSVALFEIDLKTHSRWIRDVDPNNIYRYPNWLYRFFYFPGQPNRLRPKSYVSALEQNGWTILSLEPANMLSEAYRTYTVHRDFRDKHLNWLSFIICARLD